VLVHSFAHSLGCISASRRDARLAWFATRCRQVIIIIIVVVVVEIIIVVDGDVVSYRFAVAGIFYEQAVVLFVIIPFVLHLSIHLFAFVVRQLCAAIGVARRRIASAFARTRTTETTTRATTSRATASTAIIADNNVIVIIIIVVQCTVVAILIVIVARRRANQVAAARRDATLAPHAGSNCFGHERLFVLFCVVEFMFPMLVVATCRCAMRCV
jgi:hypothetical protein